MLVEFSVENFRVFKSRQTFSMVVDPQLNRKGSGGVVSTGFASVPALHGIACIYGSNGAGKTSLVKSIKFMKQFIEKSYENSPKNAIERDNFLFDPASRERPTTFEVCFIWESRLYQYGFSLTDRCVKEEWLLVRSNTSNRKIRIFSRSFKSGESDDYDWYFNAKYINEQSNLLKTVVRPTALLLSTAVRINNKPLMSIYQWITENIVILSKNSTCFYRNLTSNLVVNKVWKPRVLKYLKKLDIRLKDIHVKKRAHNEETDFENLSFSNSPLVQKLYSDQSLFDIHFVRVDISGNQVMIPIEEESSGTIVLYDVAGLILQAAVKGYTVFMDELSSSLHPQVFSEVVSMFNDSQSNDSWSQLIFTSHDVTIPNNDVIKRDQVWLVDRSSKLSSSLYAFSEFQDKEQAPFQRVYLEGRIGAVPIIN